METEPTKVSVKTMKETIRRAGLSTADMLEKRDIEARYKQAQARLEGRERRLRVKKRKEVLRLRSLVVRRRAKKSSDAIIAPSFRLPDGVFWNVLSFWPPRCDYLYLPASLYRPAPTYRGHRPGFVFKTCDGHTGYWADVADEEDTTNLVTLVRLQDIVRSAPAAPAPTAGTDFVVPPVRQSYKQRISGCRRAPEDAGRV